jgi:hypothetical protein
LFLQGKNLNFLSKLKRKKRKRKIMTGNQSPIDVEVIDLRSSTATPQLQPPSGHSEDSHSDDDSEQDAPSPSNERNTTSRLGTPMKVDGEVNLNGDVTVSDDSATATSHHQAQGQNTAESTSTNAKPKTKAAPRSPSPPPTQPVLPRPTIRLLLTLGGPENYEVDITRLSIDTGQIPDVAVAVAPPAENVSDEESGDEKETDKEKSAKTKKRGRKVSITVLLYTMIRILGLNMNLYSPTHKSITTSGTLSSMIQNSLSTNEPTWLRLNRKGSTSH